MRTERAIRARLEKLNMTPWHRIDGIMVWRKNIYEYKLASPVGEIIDGAFTLEGAASFIMQEGIRE